LHLASVKSIHWKYLNKTIATLQRKESQNQWRLLKVENQSIYPN